MIVSGKIKQLSLFRSNDKDLLSVTLYTKKETPWRFSLGRRDEAIPDGCSNNIASLLDAELVKIECDDYSGTHFYKLSFFFQAPFSCTPKMGSRKTEDD